MTLTEMVDDLLAHKNLLSRCALNFVERLKYDLSSGAEVSVNRQKAAGTLHLQTFVTGPIRRTAKLNAPEGWR